MQPSSKQASESNDRLNSTLNGVGNGSYYSNQDITILHSVVVAAQEELDHASEPKPLPAAVLFRAYDDVLPVYGVDPDLDHHLSALVFRIGGEQGHGTLLSKFQAILGRMGIVLEFGDDTPSPEASPVFFPSPTSSFRSRLNFDVERIMSESNLNNGSDVTTAALSSADHVLQPGGEIFPEENTEIADTPVGTAMDLKSVRDDARGDVRGNPSRRFSNDEESKDAEKTSSLDGRRSALAAAFDLWRSRAAANLRQIEGLHDDRPMHNRWAPKGESLARLHQKTARTASKIPHYGPAQDLIDTKEGELHRFRAEESCAPSLVSESNNGPAEIPGQLKRDDGFYALSDDIITLSQEHHLVQCASRARQIYLASKILNHWADRTAIRLEREAVARRHMIRFRCFRAWSQAPSSRLPAVDRLRASTAVQKLQRAVAYHRSGLSQSASSTAEARSAGLVQQALARWQCRISAHNSLCTSIKRTKLDTASRWREDAWGTQALGHAATAHCADWQSHMAMQKWRARADKSKLSQKVAHHIRTLCLYSNCLDTWSDCAEVKQRSSTYRQRLYLDRAAFAFYVWNLSARAQAVRWRREFLLVESAFNAWSSGAARNTGARSAAHQHHVLDSKTRVCRRLKRLQSERANLTRLHSRAQLYLHGTRLLKVFDLTVRLRKDRTKSRIRRHLMMRYTQISSSRKKRTFLAALDRWKLASERDSRMAQTAQEVGSVDEADRCSSALADWYSLTSDDLRLQCRTESRYRTRWLERWDEVSAQQEGRGSQAWRLWASERQRRCVKIWSIAALRRSGQAHTADMVLRRHSRENLGRALQRWRSSTAGQGATSLTNRPSVQLSSHRSGKSVAGREKQPELVGSYLMETPTRWTGFPMSMSGIASTRRMTPVIESDDEPRTAAGSTAVPDVRAGQSLREETSDGGVRRMSLSTSTTPQASVPPHLRRKSRPLSFSWERSDPGTPSQAASARSDLRRIVTSSARRVESKPGSGRVAVTRYPTTPRRADSLRDGRLLGTRVWEQAAALSTGQLEALRRGQDPSDGLRHVAMK